MTKWERRRICVGCVSDIVHLFNYLIAILSVYEDQPSISSQQPVMESVEAAALIVPASVSGLIVLIFVLVIVGHVIRKKRIGTPGYDSLSGFLLCYKSHSTFVIASGSIRVLDGNVSFSKYVKVLQVRILKKNSI